MALAPEAREVVGKSSGGCKCHCTLYNVCFSFYLFLFPVFLQFLMRAPSTWDSRPFHPVPMRTLKGDVPHLNMSSFPQSTAQGVNHCRPCREDPTNKVGMYQWDISLSMSYTDLASSASHHKAVSTMYPVIFASQDFVTWQVVADADDVAGKGEYLPESKGLTEPTHISAPMLVANLKPFGCVGNETAETDPFISQFSGVKQAEAYRWKLVEHISLHGSMDLVACVMQGMDAVNDLLEYYTTNCAATGEIKCQLEPKTALKSCFALGSACGQACGFVSSITKHCIGGTLDPQLFEGLTKKRVNIKTSPGGGGASEALVYCSMKPCKAGLHFKDMYVEAQNPLDFLEDQGANKKNGGYYVVMFAMSDRPPSGSAHALTTDADDEDDEEEPTHHAHSSHHAHEEPTTKSNHSSDKDHKEPAKNATHRTAHPTPKPMPKPPAPRVCVDLPSVRLGQLGLKSRLGAGSQEGVHTPKACTEACGKQKICTQAVFSDWDGGHCYLFKMATIEVQEFSVHYNSSYCGLKDDKKILMNMLHKAYAQPRDPAPADTPPPASLTARRLWSEHNSLIDDDDYHMDSPRVLTSVASLPRQLKNPAAQKFSWQIAHVPNLTHGVLRDQGSTEVRVKPQEDSCFTQPGFIYMVACMTAKPVYLSKGVNRVAPPPFNDRCIAVGGLCGATCGSARGGDEQKARFCPIAQEDRRLVDMGNFNPFATAHIPREYLVQEIEPRRSANAASVAAKLFFHMFIFFMMLSYVAVILSKFPGNFSDFYPVHTWDEITTHGYVLDKFGSAVSCGCSSTEVKMFIMRNWIGKIASRPQFGDAAFPTFKKWVDVFVDEGHREGARILWAAWTDFLDTSPPVEFLEEWSHNVREMTWEQAMQRSPFDLKWTDGKARKVLPVLTSQAEAFAEGGDVPAMDGGITLQPESLAKLKDLYEAYKLLPDDLKLEIGLPQKVDCILTREVGLGMKTKNSILIPFGVKWQDTMQKKMEDRAAQLRFESHQAYESSVTVVDVSGKQISLAGNWISSGLSSLTEDQFPLTIWESASRSDRKVIMVYVARAKPETERKGFEKTRGLDTYLWACLRPGAVRLQFDSRNRSRADDENARLITTSRSSLDDESSCQSEDGNSRGVSPVVRKAALSAIEGDHMHLIEKVGGGAKQVGKRSNLTPLQAKYINVYKQYRTVASDWEVARQCYGEIVGEDVDMDGHEVLILDNPSPALLEIINGAPASGSGSFAGRTGMGLHEVEEVQESGRFSTRVVSRVSYKAKPSLEFMFTSSDGGGMAALNGKDFETDFLAYLKRIVTQDVSRLEFTLERKAGDLKVKVSGPGQLVENIRGLGLSNVKVLKYVGRAIDNHPTVLVRKDLLMPYAAVRGKGGGLNFVVDLLQFRDGFIGTGRDGDITPHRMLFGIFDARHQPHPDFWQMCLPKFMQNKELGYTYEVNNDVVMVQAPQSFPAIKADVDVLDINNGMAFNLMNIIRNRCGSVTSCGTNAVWQINAKEFSRKEDHAVSLEFFDSRTKVEDTASTHSHFFKGKRSVYVHEKVCTGIAKMNADYLTAVSRWAEGAVQLFWIHLFIDRSWQLIAYVCGILVFMGSIIFSLYGPSTKALLGKNLFCDVKGEATLLLGQAHSFCDSIYELFSNFLFQTSDVTIFELAVHDYMAMIDTSIAWLIVCLCMITMTAFLSWTGVMPKIVRVNVMLDNVTYFWTSCSVFFWLALILFMVMGMDPPFMFNVTHFMCFVLLLNLTQHGMINSYKDLGECSELSIWRAQQSYTLAAPLYVMAIVQGSIAAWNLSWKKLDLSFWHAGNAAPETLRAVTIWVTFIWASFVLCVCFALLKFIQGTVTGVMPENLAQQCQFGALMMLGLLSVTLWEPLLSVWDFGKAVERMSNDKESSFKRWFASLAVWWRSKAWIMRYIVDFGLPLVVLSGTTGGVSLLTLAAYATTVSGFRA